MAKTLNLVLLGMLLYSLTSNTLMAQSATVQGTVTDAELGEALIGATVLVVEPGTSTMISTSAGAATGVDGGYRITGVPAGTYELLVTYVGYAQYREPVTLSAGETLTRDVGLSLEGINLNAVVVTASRQAEKVLDAPASISVLDAREVESQPTASPAAVLRNTPGVDISQTGVDRYELVLRGFNNAFSGATYALVDYRQAAVPSLGVNAYNMMPISNIDIERIEVVRGPGSALYGAGVDAGVVHFFTKDPFSYPGTTVSLIGGERALAGVNFRHAGTVNDRFGYKITGLYTQANEWELDPSDPLDAAELEGEARDRLYDSEKLNVNGMVEYRFNPVTSLVANAGFNRSTNTFLSGIGTLQGIDFSYIYGQVRLQAGNFFAQAYMNRNDEGDSFVYGTGQEVVDNAVQVNAQAQYDLAFGERQSLIVGLDADITTPDTEGTIYGRNEDDDQIQEYGAYAQSQTQFGDRLDLTLAGRFDYNNIVEEVRFSPRAALVFKATPAHSVRATFNRAFSSPGNNSLFLDIVAGQIPNTPIIVRGRGAAEGFTFRRDPAYGPLAGTDLVASSLNPATLGMDTPAGLFLDQIYAALYAGLAATPTEELVAALAGAGLELSPALVTTLVGLLNPQLTEVDGFTQGTLGVLNLSTGGIDPIQNVVDIAPLSQTTSTTYELGYKGIINNRVLLAVDGYYVQKKDFVGPLLMETPFVLVPGLQEDLTAALAEGIAGNTFLGGAIRNLGLTPEQVAGLIVGFAGDQLPDAGTPIAIVQPAENQGAVAPELMLTYRNFGEISYSGVDLSTQILVNEQLSLFGSVSFVSDDLFRGEEIGEDEDSDLSVALNAPTFKLKTGFSYIPPAGFSVNVSGRYIEGFPVRSGPYVGEVPSYFLLDLGLGYDFSNSVDGLQFDILAQNLLNNEHREFVGAPTIGRFTTARLTFTF